MNPSSPDYYERWKIYELILIAVEALWVENKPYFIIN